MSLSDSLSGKNSKREKTTGSEKNQVLLNKPVADESGMKEIISWQTVSIFISSTFRDMHSERDILVKKVFPKIREKLLPHRIRLVDIDLRWGITAEQAENDKTIEFCLDSIEGCRPFFIGVLGERYGWIPESTPEQLGKKFPDAVAYTGTSITAMEIIHGVLSAPKIKENRGGLQKLSQAFRDPSGKGSNALFFFRNPSFEKDLPEDFKDVMASEGPVHLKKLNQLKEQIRKLSGKFTPVENYPCNYAGLSVDWNLLADEAPTEVATYLEPRLKDNFLSREAYSEASPKVVSWLRENATVVLDHLDDFANKMYEELWAMLCDSFPQLQEDPQTKIEPHILEDDAHQTVADQLTLLFLGRENLRNSFAKEKGGSLLAYSGATGSGKSALMAQLATEWKHRNPQGKVIVHFTGATPLGGNPDAFFSRMLRLVCEVAGLPIPISPEVGFAANVLRSAIENIPADLELLLAVDGLDTMMGKEGFDLRWIPETIPSSTNILLTLGDDQPGANETMNQLRDSGARFFQIPAMRQEERSELIRKLPAMWAKTMDDRQINLLSGHPAANLPLFLTIALEELRKFGSYERLAKRIEMFPTQMGEEGLVLLYNQMLERLEREFGVAVISKPLGLLATAETGLTEQEINKLCDEIDPGQLASLWRELRIHLSSQMGLLGFYHTALRKAIQQHYLSAQENRLAIHQQLVLFFQDHPDNQRALKELLNHYNALGKQEILKELLTHLPNLLIMRRHFSRELVQWWERAGVDDPLALIFSSLPNQIPEHEDVLGPKDEIALGFWTPHSGTKEIILYDESGDEFIKPSLQPIIQDALMELVRMVEESRLRNNTTVPLSVKLLAILTKEYGPVHARTLEALATAIPLYFVHIDKEDAQLFLTRALFTVTDYLPESHPVSVRIRMHVQDFMRKQDDTKSFKSDFNELMNMMDSNTECSKTRELERDQPLREGQQHLLKAFLLTRHSQMLRLAGDIKEAVEYCRKALDYSKKQLGPFNELSIQALNNLAMILIDNEGDIASGEKLLKETIALADSRIGKTSYLGLIMLNNLAAGLGNAGKYDEGLPWYKETVKRKKAIFGTTNESTLHSVYNLAWCYNKLNQHNDAIEMCQEAIKGFEKLGEGYENDLIRIQFHLVEFLDNAGKEEESQTLYGSVINRFYQLPEEKQEWLTFYLLSGYSANLLEQNGLEDDLWNLWQETLERLIPHADANTQIINLYKRMLGWLTKKVEKHTSAKDYQALEIETGRLVELHTRLFGSDGPETLQWQVLRGDTLNKLGRYEESEPLLRHAMEHLSDLKGAGDPETRNATSYLSQALMELGRNEEAEELMMSSIEAGANRKTDLMTMMQKFLKDSEIKYGANHQETLKVLDDIAQELMEKDRFEDALFYLEQAFERSEKAVGPLEPETLERAENLASGYLRLNLEEKAEPVLRRVVQIMEQTRGKEDPKTLKAMLKLGDALMSLKEYAEVAAVLENALPKVEKVYGATSEEAISILAKLSRNYDFAKNPEKSAEWYGCFTGALKKAINESRMQEMTIRYTSRANDLREERIEMALNTIYEMKQQGKLDYLGEDPEQLRSTAIHMSESDLDAENPEGSEEIKSWIGILQWLNPDELSLSIWSTFCDRLEQNLDKADPVRYMPRLRYCQWLAHYEGFNLMMEPLGLIWQQGDINSLFVQKAAQLMFRILSEQAEMDLVIELGEQILDAFRENLDIRNPALHLMMHDVAKYLAEQKQTTKAIQLYDELIQSVSANLKADHPFLQKLMEERNNVSA
ncbi:MAG: hypothetical protein C0595_11890 [Marinilabiliales bacterium]|nr:MAG: hypothetical protein C0595_11890 [Marinilabiliales bacterium]